MALADLAAQAEHEPAPWQTCAVCHSLANIPAKEAAGLRSLLGNKAKRFSEISDEIRNDPDTPLDIPATALRRHARGDCKAREKLR